MKREFKNGLVVGKFAPLHLGHLHVIEQAIARCERVVVLSYMNPEIQGYEPKLRRHWLRACAPNVESVVLDAQTTRATPANDAPDDEHREFVARWLIDERDIQIDAVFTSEAYGPGFASWLQRAYVAAGHELATVAHIAVDPGRSAVPVSGTKLRGNLWENWHWLPSPVARTMVRRIALLGGESTGKSTLAKSLAAQWKTHHVPEYGRELWEGRRGRLRVEDMEAIALEQLKREDEAAANARRFVFCDTSPLTTLFYSEVTFGAASDRLRAVAARSYDLTVLCEADFPFVQDGTRQPESFRDRQQHWYDHELNSRQIPYIVAKGPLEERMETVRASLDRLT